MLRKMPFFPCSYNAAERRVAFSKKLLSGQRLTCNVIFHVTKLRLLLCTLLMMTSDFVMALECLYVKAKSRVLPARKLPLLIHGVVLVNSVRHRFLCNKNSTGFYAIITFCRSTTLEKMLRKVFSCTYNGSERHVTCKCFKKATSRAKTHLDVRKFVCNYARYWWWRQFLWVPRNA